MKHAEGLRYCVNKGHHDSTWQVLEWAQKGVFSSGLFHSVRQLVLTTNQASLQQHWAVQIKKRELEEILFCGAKEHFQAAITFLLCVHNLSCWVQVLAWALAAVEGKWLCMRHLDQLPAGCCCSPHPPPNYQGYRLAQICSGLRLQASPLQL